jgi:hypothetical protein
MLYNTDKDNFKDNNISFVTFNYDRSLEHYLYTCLKNYFRDLMDDDISNTIQQFGFIHIYGQLGFLPWQIKDGLKIEYGNARGYDELVSVKDSIKLIDERTIDRKLKDDLTKIFAKASRVYFLGFGYDQSNMKIIHNYIHSHNNIFRMGTVYGLSPIEIRELQTRTGKDIKFAPPDNDALRFFKEFAELN